MQRVPLSHLIPIEPLEYDIRFFHSDALTNFNQPKFIPLAFPTLPVNDNHSSRQSSGSAEVGIDGGSTTGDSTGSDDDDETDGSGDAETTTPLNRRPQVAGPVVLHDQFVCIMLMFSLSDLLRGAIDLDGDALSVKNVSVSNGELELIDGVYRFHGEDMGPVTISYDITDGKLSTAQTANFNLLAKPPIVGTDDDDILLGTACADDIIGNDGDDRIDGRDRDDNIDGGSGNDHIVGGNGNDVVWGGLGDDVILGNSGNDMLFGGAGNDRIFGGEGNDIIDGGDGNDVVFGDAGNDVIDGGSGDDQLNDGEGLDRVNGGAGNDVFIAAIDNVSDQFIGGEGQDTLDYSAAERNLEFNLVTAEVMNAETGGDLFASIEHFIGGSGNDHFLFAAEGQPTNVENIASAEGDCDHEQVEDTETPLIFDGGTGSDTLDYSERSEALIIDTVENIVYSTNGPNHHFSSIEVVVGGDGDDLFIVGAHVSTFDGRGGDDTFRLCEAASEDASPYQIRNFEIGDRINVLSYDIFEREDETDEHSLEGVYGGGESDHNETFDRVFPIRVRRQDAENDTYRTIVDVDMDGDEAFDMSVELDGHHYLLVTTHTTA